MHKFADELLRVKSPRVREASKISGGIRQRLEYTVVSASGHWDHKAFPDHFKKHKINRVLV